MGNNEEIVMPGSGGILVLTFKMLLCAVFAWC